MGDRLKYPLGQQSFRCIREEGKVYIDKTQFIPLLLENKFYFLSRPRRFGKSLFLSVLENFFLGRRELFKGLAVDSFDWAWEEFPVIRINLAEGDFSSPTGLTERLIEIAEELELKFKISPVGPTPRARFRNIILNLTERLGKGVVVLVDEYEKPLLDTLDKGHHENFKELLSDFYSVFKGNEEHIRFLFMTGVTRFGHLNIFSGFNNITDISLDERYTAICGITENEVKTYLREGITELGKKLNVDEETALAELKSNYDGYHFSEDLTDIYNPYSLLSALESGKMEDIWSLTGNSTFLLKQLQKVDFNLFELEGVVAHSNTLKGIEPDFTDPITLLYQSGYLTIKSYDSSHKLYTLGLPNQEVATALYKSVIPFYLGNNSNLRPTDYLDIRKWLESGQIEDFITWLKQFFSKITYDVKLFPLKDRMKHESDFQFVIFSILSLACGINNVELEQTTSNGRLDLSLTVPDYIYIFEFKIGENAGEALRQIRDKGYALRWAGDRRKIVEVGVAFSPEMRNIVEAEWS